MRDSNPGNAVPFAVHGEKRGDNPMRSCLGKVLAGLVVLTITGIGAAQPPPKSPQPDRILTGSDEQDVSEPVKEIEARQTELAALRQKQDELKKGTDDQKKQIELLQKQVETMEKMIKLLADQLKKQPAAGPAMEKLQTQTATLEARSLQAARRDKDLANAVDDIHEHVDAEERNGPHLSPQLKELFFPSGTNETTLSIYGALSFGYSKIQGDSTTAANGAGRPSTPGGFYFGEFSPDFLLKLNDWKSPLAPTDR
jgi:TolA-binding protein